MAKRTLEIPIEELNRKIENYLDKNYRNMEKALKKQLIENHSQEIKEDDIVKCVYKQGFYRVYGFTDDKVIISKLDLSGDFEQVSHKYLKVIDIDLDVARVLYEDK